MFTGIVEERGSVREVSSARLVVSCSTVAGGTEVGDSIAVNGCCLTVVERGEDRLAFDLSDETVRRTSLSRLREGHPVNLERPVTLMSRLGGHLVQGHVDGVGRVTAFERSEGGATLVVRPPDELESRLVEKGSVAVDGVSLTVAGISDGTFSVALIPHTLAATTLGGTQVDDPVNLETDVIAKYVAKNVEVLRGFGG